MKSLPGLHDHAVGRQVRLPPLRKISRNAYIELPCRDLRLWGWSGDVRIKKRPCTEGWMPLRLGERVKAETVGFGFPCKRASSLRVQSSEAPGYCSST